MIAIDYFLIQEEELSELVSEIKGWIREQEGWQLYGNIFALFVNDRTLYCQALVKSKSRRGLSHDD